MVNGFINFLFSFLSHISFIFSFSNSVFSHTLSFSLFPFDLFSSHSWIWATTDFLSTITNLLHRVFFFPLLFTLSSLFYLWHCRFAILFFSELPIQESQSRRFPLYSISEFADSLFVVLKVAEILSTIVDSLFSLATISLWFGIWDYLIFYSMVSLRSF